MYRLCATSLRASDTHSTTLAATIVTPHCAAVSGSVPNAVLRNGRKTTATCNRAERATAPHSQAFENRPRNALRRSERALKTLKSWASTSVVNAIVRATRSLDVPSTSPPGNSRSSTNSVATAIAVPFSAMLTHIGPSTTRAARERGGRRMRRASGGSMPTARAGAASVSRLIHKIWVASSGVHDAVAAARQPQHAREHDAEEHRHDLARVRRQQVADELPDVREDRPPLLDRGHDRREVVVGEDHVRGFLGDVGAGDAHRDADIGRLQRGRVVHAVAGHRHHVAGALQGTHDPQLVLGAHPRVDVHPTDRLVEGPVVHALELGAGGDRRVRRGDAHLAGDRARGDRVVAGDHHHPDAGALGRGDRRGGLLTRRIDDAQRAEEDEVRSRSSPRPS